ncbi:MAG: hypothetical protein QOE71_364 [Pseudonocardiales bacterium]|nr:hypothetical protein [Pseudonocardiales bacterium]
MTGHQAGEATPLNCGWCGEEFAWGRVGRRPKWCSESCRHRAWEQRRAAESGRSAVEVVERVVVREVRAEVMPRGREWATVLRELALQIDRGRVYDRDLDAITESFAEVMRSLNRRDAWLRRGQS